jgi:hypothetical protein
MKYGSFCEQHPSFPFVFSLPQILFPRRPALHLHLHNQILIFIHLHLVIGARRRDQRPLLLHNDNWSKLISSVIKKGDEITHINVDGFCCSCVACRWVFLFTTPNADGTFPR